MDGIRIRRHWLTFNAVKKRLALPLFRAVSQSSLFTLTDWKE